jgi:hypothetical protein
LDNLKPRSSEIYREVWRERNFNAVFEFIGLFFLQNDVFKLEEVLSELEISVFLENGLGSCQTFLIFVDFRQTICAKKIPKTVLKTRLKT